MLIKISASAVACVSRVGHVERRESQGVLIVFLRPDRKNLKIPEKFHSEGVFVSFI
jgi:hypothetical protein